MDHFEATTLFDVMYRRHSPVGVPGPGVGVNDIQNVQQGATQINQGPPAVQHQNIVPQDVPPQYALHSPNMHNPHNNITSPKMPPQNVSKTSVLRQFRKTDFMDNTKLIPNPQQYQQIQQLQPKHEEYPHHPPQNHQQPTDCVPKLQNQNIVPNSEIINSDNNNSATYNIYNRTYYQENGQKSPCFENFRTVQNQNSDKVCNSYWPNQSVVQNPPQDYRYNYCQKKPVDNFYLKSAPNQIQNYPQIDRRISPVQNFPPQKEYDARYYQQFQKIPQKKPNFTILEQRLTNQNEFVGEYHKFPVIQSKGSPTPRPVQFPTKPEWPYPREFRDNRFFADVAQLDPRMAQGIIQHHNSIKNYDIPRDRFIENARYQNKIIRYPEQRPIRNFEPQRTSSCKVEGFNREEMYMRNYPMRTSVVDHPQRNISPRSTFQENMHTIVIPPQGIQNFTPNDFYNQHFNDLQRAQRPFQQRFENLQDYRYREYQEAEARKFSIENKDPEVSKLNLKEFFENWEDDEEIVANLPDLIPCNNIERNMSVDSNYVSESSNDKASYEDIRSTENLYILEKQNISPEMLSKFQHLTPVERLPDNIKDYQASPRPNSDQVLNLSLPTKEAPAKEALAKEALAKEALAKEALAKEENNNKTKVQEHKSVIVSNVKFDPQEIPIPKQSPGDLPLTIPFKKDSSYQTENVNRLLEYVNNNTIIDTKEGEECPNAPSPVHPENQRKMTDGQVLEVKSPEVGDSCSALGVQRLKGDDGAEKSEVEGLRSAEAPQEISGETKRAPDCALGVQSEQIAPVIPNSEEALEVKTSVVEAMKVDGLRVEAPGLQEILGEVKRAPDCALEVQRLKGGVGAVEVPNQEAPDKVRTPCLEEKPVENIQKNSESAPGGVEVAEYKDMSAMGVKNSSEKSVSPKCVEELPDDVDRSRTVSEDFKVQKSVYEMPKTKASVKEFMEDLSKGLNLSEDEKIQEFNESEIEAIKTPVSGGIEIFEAPKDLQEILPEQSQSVPQDVTVDSPPSSPEEKLSPTGSDNEAQSPISDVESIESPQEVPEENFHAIEVQSVVEDRETASPNHLESHTSPPTPEDRNVHIDKEIQNSQTEDPKTDIETAQLETMEDSKEFPHLGMGENMSVHSEEILEYYDTKVESDPVEDIKEEPIEPSKESIEESSPEKIESSEIPSEKLEMETPVKTDSTEASPKREEVDELEGVPKATETDPKDEPLNSPSLTERPNLEQSLEELIQPHREQEAPSEEEDQVEIQTNQATPTPKEEAIEKLETRDIPEDLSTSRRCPDSETYLTEPQEALESPDNQSKSDINVKENIEEEVLTVQSLDEREKSCENTSNSTPGEPIPFENSEERPLQGTENPVGISPEGSGKSPMELDKETDLLDEKPKAGGASEVLESNPELPESTPAEKKVFVDSAVQTTFVYPALPTCTNGKKQCCIYQKLFYKRKLITRKTPNKVLQKKLKLRLKKRVLEVKKILSRKRNCQVEHPLLEEEMVREEVETDIGGFINPENPDPEYLTDGLRLNIPSRKLSIIPESSEDSITDNILHFPKRRISETSLPKAFMEDKDSIDDFPITKRNRHFIPIDEISKNVLDALNTLSDRESESKKSDSSFEERDFSQSSFESKDSDFYHRSWIPPEPKEQMVQSAVEILPDKLEKKPEETSKTDIVETKEVREERGAKEKLQNFLEAVKNEALVLGGLREEEKATSVELGAPQFNLKEARVPSFDLEGPHIVLKEAKTPSVELGEPQNVLTILEEEKAPSVDLKGPQIISEDEREPLDHLKSHQSTLEQIKPSSVELGEPQAISEEEKTPSVNFKEPQHVLEAVKEPSVDLGVAENVLEESETLSGKEMAVLVNVEDPQNILEGSQTLMEEDKAPLLDLEGPQNVEEAEKAPSVNLEAPLTTLEAEKAPSEHAQNISEAEKVFPVDLEGPQNIPDDVKTPLVDLGVPQNISEDGEPSKEIPVPEVDKVQSCEEPPTLEKEISISDVPQGDVEASKVDCSPPHIDLEVLKEKEGLLKSNVEPLQEKEILPPPELDLEVIPPPKNLQDCFKSPHLEAGFIPPLPLDPHPEEFLDSRIGIICDTINDNYDEGILRNSPVHSEVYYEEYIIENTGTYEDILISSDQTVIVTSDECSNDILKERQVENPQLVLEEPGDEILIENDVENIFQEVIIEDTCEEKNDLLEDHLEDPLASNELTPPPEFPCNEFRRPFMNGFFSKPFELDIKKSLNNLIRRPNGTQEKAKTKKINLSDYRKRRGLNGGTEERPTSAEIIEQGILQMGQEERIGSTTERSSSSRSLNGRKSSEDERKSSEDERKRSLERREPREPKETSEPKEMKEGRKAKMSTDFYIRDDRKVAKLTIKRPKAEGPKDPPLPLNGKSDDREAPKKSRNPKKMYLLEENGRNMLFLEPLVLKRSNSYEGHPNEAKRPRLDQSDRNSQPKRRRSEGSGKERNGERRKSQDKPKKEEPKIFQEYSSNSTNKELIPITKRKRKKKRFRNLYTLSDSDDDPIPQNAELKVKIPRDCFDVSKFIANKEKTEVPKVLIKKNGTTYVSSFMKNIKEPFWQPRVILKRYPSSEILKITKKT